MRPKKYFFALENPFYDGGVDFYKNQEANNCFRKLENFYIKLFKEGLEEKVLKDLKNSSLRLPISKQETKYPIIKMNGSYYQNCGGMSTINKSSKNWIILDQYEKLDIKKWIPLAIKVLREVIPDEKISLADMTKVRDIAIQAFLGQLEFLSKKEPHVREYPGDTILSLNQNDWALNELIRYGFKVNPYRTMQIYLGGGSQLPD